MVFMLAAAVFINYIDRGAMPLAAHMMQGELKLDDLEMGKLLSAFFWTYSLVQIPVGWVAERVGAQRVLAVALTVWAAATLLTGFAHTFAVLMSLRLLLGLGESAAFPSVAKLLALSVPPRGLGTANGIVGFAYLFGPAVGTYVGGRLMNAYGWRVPFWVFGALSLCWLMPWRGVVRRAHATGALGSRAPAEIAVPAASATMSETTAAAATTAAGETTAAECAALALSETAMPANAAAGAPAVGETAAAGETTAAECAAQALSEAAMPANVAAGATAVGETAAAGETTAAESAAQALSEAAMPANAAAGATAVGAPAVGSRAPAEIAGAGETAVGQTAAAGATAARNTPSFRQLLTSPALWGTGLGLFSSNYLLFFMLSWLPSYLQRERGSSTLYMANLTSAGYLVNALSALAGGWLIDRWIARGARPGVAYKSVMAVAHVGFVPCMLGMASGRPLVALVALFAYQVLCGASSPGVYAMSQILAGPRSAGRWVGIQNTLGSTAGIVAPWLTGAIVQNTGRFADAFVVAAAMSVLGLVGWLWMIPALAELRWRAA